MRKFLLTLAAGLYFMLPIAPAEAQTKVQVVAASCGSENAKCTKFCRTERPTEGCFSDCKVRLASCAATGCYIWKNRPNVCGLSK